MFYSSLVEFNLDIGNCSSVSVPAIINKKGIRVAHMNVRSLFPVVHDIFHLIAENILLLTETWLDSSISNEEVVLRVFQYIDDIVALRIDW